MVPYDSPRVGSDYFAAELPNPLDATGRYSATNPSLEHLHASSGADLLHYASAAFYTRLFSFANSAPPSEMGDSFGTYNRFNTLMFQASAPLAFDARPMQAN